MDSLGTLSDEVAANSDCFGFAFLARGTLKHFEFKRGVLKSCTKYKLCWAGDKEKEGKSFIISPPYAPVMLWLALLLPWASVAPLTALGWLTVQLSAGG
jgi:hypothetical protein